MSEPAQPSSAWNHSIEEDNLHFLIFFSPLPSPPFLPEIWARLCAAHMAELELSTRGAGAVKPQQRGGGGRALSGSPWHPFRGTAPRSRPSPARLHRRESQQNGGAARSHVTPLCFRGRLGAKCAVATWLTDKISSPRAPASTSVVEAGPEMYNFVEIRRVHQRSKHGGHFAQACAGSIVAALHRKTRPK